MNRLAMIILICWVETIFSANLGVIGETFPVAEMSFLDFIESRLNELENSGEINTIKDRMIQDVSLHANRPTSLNLVRTNQNKIHRYVPSIMVVHPIVDHFNHTVIPAGTRVNALEQLPSYQPYWMFLDADDHAQLLWGKLTLNAHPDAHVILTGGSVADAEKVLNTEIFFDQQGRITHQLKIEHVPAFVSRDDLALRIEEVAIREDGYAR